MNCKNDADYDTNDKHIATSIDGFIISLLTKCVILILSEQILLLGNNPYMGIDPRYLTLRRQGYKVMITEKNLIFYKINESKKCVTIHAVVDQRQDYVNIIRGL